jgi:serine/threonine-protein kinase
MQTPHLPDTILRERYRLTGVVGQGGMGCVYRAEDLRLPGRLCAIKEVQLDPQESAETRAQTHDQFLREASILARLDHPSLPKVSDFFTSDHREYLVMDFVEGADLKQLLDQSTRQGELLAVDDVLVWAHQIAEALTWLHQQNPPVLHRDIKPSNIKLTPSNRIKLVDFGLVKLLAQDEMRTLTVLQGRGTAFYTPLEQYGGDSGHTDARSDIYAFGATLYHLLTAKAPAEAKSRFLSPGALRSPRELNPNVSERVSDAVLWAMAMHPDQRPADMGALTSVLFGTGALPRPVERQTVDVAPWLEAARANSVPILLLLALFALALFLTLGG